MKIEDEKAEVINMCKAWEEWHEDGIEIGRQNGILATRLEAIRNMIIKLKMTAMQAMDILDIPENEREKYLTLLQ